MEEKKRAVEELAKESADFLNELAEDCMRRGIPPKVVISLFGMFSRQVVDGLIENGMSREEAITEVAGRYMDGLGVATLFKHINLADDAKPPMPH